MTYDIAHFRAKFSAIPYKRWRVGGYGSDGVHCAMGHCDVTWYNSNQLHGEAMILETLFNQTLACTVTDVNDNIGLGHALRNIKRKRTPKARILAALDMIEEKMNDI